MSYNILCYYYYLKKNTCKFSLLLSLSNKYIIVHYLINQVTFPAILELPLASALLLYL